MDESQAPQIDQARIDAFWGDARIRANLNRTNVVTGPTVMDTVPPPVWSFGATAQGDQLLGLVLTGAKTAVSEPLRDLTDRGDPLPERGDLSILVDSSGSPRALLRTTEVTVVPFDLVDEGHARAEAEGDGTLADWRRRYRSRLAAPTPVDGVMTPEVSGGSEEGGDMPVVCERFDVLVPTRSERRRLPG